MNICWPIVSNNRYFVHQSNSDIEAVAQPFRWLLYRPDWVPLYAVWTVFANHRGGAK